MDEISLYDLPDKAEKSILVILKIGENDGSKNRSELVNSISGNTTKDLLEDKEKEGKKIPYGTFRDLQDELEETGIVKSSKESGEVYPVLTSKGEKFYDYFKYLNDQKLQKNVQETLKSVLADYSDLPEINRENIDEITLKVRAELDRDLEKERVEGAVVNCIKNVYDQVEEERTILSDEFKQRMKEESNRNG